MNPCESIQELVIRYPYSREIIEQIVAMQESGPLQLQRAEMVIYESIKAGVNPLSVAKVCKFNERTAN